MSDKGACDSRKREARNRKIALPFHPFGRIFSRFDKTTLAYLATKDCITL